MKLLRNTLTGLSALTVLLACTPTFKTTEQLCQAHLPTRQAVQSYNIELYDTDDDGNQVRTIGYPLYAEDFLNSFKNIQSKAENGDLSPLSSEEQAVIDFIFAQVDQNMSYTRDTDGTVVSANNPLDFMASLIATIDNSKLVQTFVEAKEQVSAAIAKDDGHCTYSNTQIEFIREDDSLNILDSFDAELHLSYVPSPFVEIDNKVDQTIIVNFDNDAESDTNNSIQFSALDRIAPENFKATGFSEAKVQQMRVINEEPPEILTIDEDYLETKLGTLGYAVFNQTCVDDTEEKNVITCPEESRTKAVEHPACSDGVDDDGDSTINLDVADESNTVLIKDFSIGDSEALKNLKRLRVEVNYPNNEIRVYASKFSTAIYKALEDDRVTEVPQGSDNPNPSPEQLILNPTSCEEFSVSKDLFDMQEEEEAVSISATDYLDPGYEYIEVTDENGDPVLDEDGFVQTIAPTPLFIFQGTAIPERQ
jgi:hypothetical protein